jgi:hypothetical protein
LVVVLLVVVLVVVVELVVVVALCTAAFVVPLPVETVSAAAAPTAEPKLAATAKPAASAVAWRRTWPARERLDATPRTLASSVKASVGAGSASAM